jgi:demethylmenaquinone methyltransferase/2-methoxy-6-polyprenyl-1,4-benzoquinol methylase
MYAQENIKPYEGNAHKREQVEQLFDNIASTYDALNHTLSFGFDRAWRRKAIRALAAYNPASVLDVATGTGDFALAIARELKLRQVTAVDISEGMMSVGREKAAREGLHDVVCFQKEDCSHLSFADESFDAVSVTFGVRNFENLDACLCEIHRVLNKGGHLVLLELSYPHNRLWRFLFNIYSKVVMPVVGRIISGDDSAYTYLPETMAAFPQGEVMREILLKNGFSQVSFRRLTMGICTLYIAEK